MNKPYFKQAKINAFRLYGMVFTLIGLGIMVLGTGGILLFGNPGKIVAAIFLVLGLISMMVSMVIYFWAGMLSTSARIIVCPECNRQTKILGTTDRCMFCTTILTLDPAIATENIANEALPSDKAAT